MKNVYGVWLPDHEQHLQQFADGEGWRYQDVKYRKALKFARKFDHAVDVGAHCGLWAMQMVDDFQHVTSFEPVAEHRECWQKNVIGNATLLPYALGETFGKVKIRTAQGSSGDSWVDGEGEIEMRPLDSFNLDCDFLKIDCEGFELFVLKGAVDTLQRCKPVLVVEQKPGHGKRFGLGDADAIPFLEKMGAKLRDSISGDFIFTW